MTLTLLLVLLLLLLAVTGSPWPLMGIILLVLLPLASWGMNRYVRKHLRVDMTLPTTTSKNAAAECVLQIHNDARLPVLRYFCIVTVQNDLTGEREHITLTGGVGTHGSGTHRFLLQSRYCGRLTASVDAITLMDYFGILPTRAEAAALARTTVLPELFPMEVTLLASPCYAEDGTVARRGEDRSEMFQLREYRAGDDIRQIHWKLSAKTDELILREASQPESRELLLFWDKHITGTPAQMDALAEAASSVAGALVRGGVSFSLCWTEPDDLPLRDISDEASLLQAVPELVRMSGGMEGRMPELTSFSRVLYFGTQPDAQLQTDPRVHFLLCMDAEQGGSPAMTVFTAETMHERLQRWEV